MTPEELARSKREAHQLSDAQLGVLLREGPSGLPSDAWDVLQYEKARREAEELSDAALGKLLREGPDTQQNGAWDVLKEEEERRRERERAEVTHRTPGFHRTPPSSASDDDEERKYPALRAIIVIHQAIAILALVLGVGLALTRSELPPLVRGAVLLAGVLVCLFQWAVAETLQVVIDIEANTRRTSTR
jgi:hypothetical protein